MTLILGALDGELASIIRNLRDTRVSHWNGYPVHEGIFVPSARIRGAAATAETATDGPAGSQSARVVVARTGVGKVQAALLAQHLVDAYHPARIIMVGVAGALDERLEVGDLVIATGTVQHDMDVTTLGFAPGAIPYTEYHRIACDPGMVALAQDLEPEDDESIYSGLVISGDQFIDDRGRRADLAARHDALCVEMEGAAVGLVAHVNRIPFCLLRIISDHADGKAANFEEVLELAADRALHYLSQKFFTGRDEDVPRTTEQ